MLNRSKRDGGDHIYYVDQKQTVVNGRKFGNIINRLQKPSRSPMPKAQYRESPCGAQNPKHQQSAASNKKKHTPNENNYIHPTPFEPSASQTTSINLNQGHRKQSDKRNREFVSKVENINKMHQQISSLLKYVKNGQSKSVCKQKDIPDNNSTTTKSIQNIIKFRMNTSSIGDKHSISQRNFVQQNQILPITQGDRQKKHLPNKSNKSYIERTQMDSFNISNFKKQPNISHQTPVNNNSATGKLNYRINNQNRANQAQANLQQKYTLNIRQQITHAFRQKEDDLELNNLQKRQMEATQKKNKFVYNFDSKESQIKQFVNTSELKRKEGKYEKNAIDYDYEIEKVKERIEDSQQMTKKMEEKYLLSHNNDYLNPTHSHSKFIKQYENKGEGREKMNKSTSDIKRKNEVKKRYLNYQQLETKTERTNNFEIKIHACKSRIQIEGQGEGKDQMNRIIASKLSDQVKLDQKLRDAREIFNNCKAHDKWKLLHLKLKDIGYSYTQQQLEKQLVISSNQSNPFQNQSYTSTDSINILAEAFVNAEDFWERELSKFVSKYRLENCGYSVKQMDLDQRGYLTVQDLVCFINLYSSNFFRNRDLICLFRRMMALGKNSHGIQYQCFLNIISSQ